MCWGLLLARILLPGACRPHPAPHCWCPAPLQVEAVDYLLDPQHLLPWTAADLRAAAAALRRHQLVEAADRYMAACRAAGEDAWCYRLESQL